MKRDLVQAYIDQRASQRDGVYQIIREDETHFQINGHQYLLIKDYREGFDPDQLANRFSSILSKYDYIVGDWGHNQLRLRGFYQADNPLFDREHSVDLIQDYLYEECNFGCAYFIIKNLEVAIPRNIVNRKRGSRAPKEYREHKRTASRPKPRYRKNQEVTSVKNNRQNGRRKFVIRDKKKRVHNS